MGAPKALVTGQGAAWPGDGPVARGRGFDVAVHFNSSSDAAGVAEEIRARAEGRGDWRGPARPRGDRALVPSAEAWAGR